ncbi:MAG TPA: PaaI family thioesterase [Saprospiraceae bacterium]|nr:PaaI family thioesterase [Saprospiraceae bacterium]
MDDKKKLELLNSIIPNTLMETLDIKYTEVGEGFLVATMPVNSRVHQPLGLLHGGASLALAESVASTASHFLIDGYQYENRGLEMSANHLKSVRSGLVTATARVIHKGRTTHLWEIRIVDAQNNLVTLCKLTNIVLPKSK